MVSGEENANKTFAASSSSFPKELRVAADELVSADWFGVCAVSSGLILMTSRSLMDMVIERSDLESILCKTGISPKRECIPGRGGSIGDGSIGYRPDRSVVKNGETGEGLVLIGGGRYKLGF